MNIHISLGNSKLGRIPSVSFPPVVTCPVGTPCAKKCYAMKAWRQYPNVRTALSENLALYNDDSSAFFRQVCDWLERHPKVTRFRFNVSGDAPDKFFLLVVNLIAKRFPNVRFLVFTKRYDWASYGSAIADGCQYAPNLSVVLSAWPLVTLKNPRNLPVAQFVPKGIYELNPSSFDNHPDTCHGSCANCSKCWDMKAGDKVYLIEH